MKKIKTVAGKKGFNRFPVFELIMLSNNSLPRCSLAKVINVPNVAIEWATGQKHKPFFYWFYAVSLSTLRFYIDVSIVCRCTVNYFMKKTNKVNFVISSLNRFRYINATSKNKLCPTCNKALSYGKIMSDRKTLQHDTKEHGKHRNTTCHAPQHNMSSTTKPRHMTTPCHTTHCSTRENRITQQNHVTWHNHYTHNVTQHTM